MFSTELVKYLLEMKDAKMNLITGEQPELKDIKERKVIGHWKENITLTLVVETSPLQMASNPPQLTKRNHIFFFFFKK